MVWSLEPVRELARIRSADIGDVYNGMLGLVVAFEYEGCGVQCLSGYLLDAAMVARFMGAVGAKRLSEAAGLSCWVTHTNEKITRIEPLHAKDGRPFDIAEWQEWAQRRITPVSWHELVTGQDPATRSRPEGA